MDFNGTAGPAHSPVRPPAVEQGYRTGELLGENGSARVWLAVRGHDGARFALKTAAAAGSGPAGTFETRRELNILSRFEHENLLRLHTVLETDQGPGLLMEYAPGGSLVRLAALRQTVTPGEAVTVLVGVGSALAYLHSQGIAHGRVSPGNILFTAQGKPLLGDCGTDRLLGAPGAAGSTPAAPDTDRPGAGAGSGPLQGSPAADVLALAAAGWLLLTGHALPPREHRPRLSALAPAVPPQLAEAVEAGLSAEPAARPDAAEFVRLVFASAVAEPLDLVLPIPDGAEPGTQTRRARIERGRASLGLQSRGRGQHGGRPGPQTPEHRRPNRLLLSAAAVLVAAVAGVGAVAVAAPELLQGQGGAVPEQGAAPGEGIAPGEGTGSGEGAGSGEGTGPGEGTVPGEETAPEEGAEAGEAGQGGQSGADPGTPGQPEQGTGSAGGQGPLTVTPEPELQALLRGDDPAAAAGALAELRARAFSTADAALLDGVNVPDSSAMLADRAEIAKLEAAGTVLAGLSVEVLSAGPAVPGEAGRVSVPAAVSTSAYAERDAQGGMVRNAAALSRQDIVLVMVRTPAGWRIEAILAAPA
ncbi:protein kinase domain-containing protein [Arthrobacter sp. G119Y2]|uniref:protein kinase domain-containing protein n=1 Tax=Arthrobacter sp. G119Y2 TaxID=3134965 RepID=UPI00311942EA